jgi:hypothetical protein
MQNRHAEQNQFDQLHFAHFADPADLLHRSSTVSARKADRQA